MNTKLMAVLMTATALATAGSTQAADGNPDAGKKKTQMCTGCHGIEGFRTAFPEVYSVPKLGGQSANYIVAALKAYKSGDRVHPSMRAIAGSLSDQDMSDLAAYYTRAAGSAP
jgi:cytochrome c553